jgi:hypothetical protein
MELTPVLKFEKTSSKWHTFLVGNCQRKDMLKVAQFWTFLSICGCFLNGNKDSNPWLWDSNLLALPHNSQKDSNLRIPIRGFVSPLLDGRKSVDGGAVSQTPYLT